MNISWGWLSMNRLIKQVLLPLSSSNITIKDDKVLELAKFAQNLSDFGVERGLTALTEREDIVRELIVDSLGAVPFIKGTCKVADLGSGSGVPGIPLAVVNPDSIFVMVESQNRKVRWIDEQISELGLLNAKTLPMRIEDVGRDSQWREKFDLVVAKALAPLPSLIELALPLLKVGGLLLAYKGIKLSEELALSQNALKSLSGKVEEIFKYNLPGRERNICVIKKLKATPKSYPRRVGMAQRNPL